MAQDFVRYSAQATNSASTIFTANSNDAVIGIRVTTYNGWSNYNRCICYYNRTY
jgi:uncharacterized membrane protein